MVLFFNDIQAKKKRFICDILCSNWYYTLKRLRRRLSFPLLFAIGLGSIRVDFPLVWQSSDFTLVAVEMLFSGMGKGQVLSGLSLWTLELTTPQTRGRNLGTLTTCFFLGQFVSPLVVQPIVVLTDLASVFGVASAIALTVAFGFVMYHLATKKDK